MSATAAEPLTDAQDTQAFVERMQKMAQGELPPPNDMVAYLLGAYKDAQAEADAAQKQLLAAQELLLKLRGRMVGLEADLRHWADK